MIKEQVSISPAMAVAMLQSMEEYLKESKHSHPWLETLPRLPQEWWEQAEKLPQTQAGSSEGMEITALEATKTNDVMFFWSFVHALEFIKFSLVEVWIALFKAAVAKQVPELPPGFYLQTLEYANKVMYGLRANESKEACRCFELEERLYALEDQQ